MPTGASPRGRSSAASIACATTPGKVRRLARSRTARRRSSSSEAFGASRSACNRTARRRSERERQPASSARPRSPAARGRGPVRSLRLARSASASPRWARASRHRSATCSARARPSRAARSDAARSRSSRRMRDRSISARALRSRFGGDVSSGSRGSPRPRAALLPAQRARQRQAALMLERLVARASPTRPRALRSAPSASARRRSSVQQTASSRPARIWHSAESSVRAARAAYSCAATRRRAFAPPRRAAASIAPPVRPRRGPPARTPRASAAAPPRRAGRRPAAPRPGCRRARAPSLFSSGTGRRRRPRLRRARAPSRGMPSAVFRRRTSRAIRGSSKPPSDSRRLRAREPADEPPRRSFRLPHGVENLRRRGAVVRIDVNHAGHRRPPHRLDLNRAICAPRASLRHEAQVRPCPATCRAGQQAGSGRRAVPTPVSLLSQQAQVAALAVPRSASATVRAPPGTPARTLQRAPAAPSPSTAFEAPCRRRRRRAPWSCRRSRCDQHLAERRHRTPRLKHHADGPLPHAAAVRDRSTCRSRYGAIGGGTWIPCAARNRMACVTTVRAAAGDAASRPRGA